MSGSQPVGWMGGTGGHGGDSRWEEKGSHSGWGQQKRQWGYTESMLALILNHPSSSICITRPQSSPSHNRFVS